MKMQNTKNSQFKTTAYDFFGQSVLITGGAGVLSGEMARPFILTCWEYIKQLPLGVLAHSTHMRGSGIREGGVENPIVKATQASKFPSEDYACLNLNYLDPTKVKLGSFQDKGDEGVLFIPRAGEILHRLAMP